MLYRLKLSLFIKKLYLVFNIVKLTTVLKNLILDQYILPLLVFIIIDKEKEWKVEQVLNSY